MDLRSRARMMASTYGIKMIIVDYLQLMQSTSNYRGNKVQEITEIANSKTIIPCTTRLALRKSPRMDISAFTNNLLYKLFG